LIPTSKRPDCCVDVFVGTAVAVDATSPPASTAAAAIRTIRLDTQTTPLGSLTAPGGTALKPSAQQRETFSRLPQIAAAKPFQPNLYSP
jgi:hypothetical protein